MDAPRFVAWALLAVVLGLVVFTNWRLRGLEPSFLAPQFTYRRRSFEAVAQRWSPAQRAEYCRLLRVDFVTLACYAGFGALWVAGSPAGAAWLTAALPMAAIADALENALHLHFLRPASAPAGDGLHLVAGLASAARFALIGAFVVGALASAG